MPILHPQARLFSGFSEGDQCITIFINNDVMYLVNRAGCYIEKKEKIEISIKCIRE